MPPEITLWEGSQPSSDWPTAYVNVSPYLRWSTPQLQKHFNLTPLLYNHLLLNTVNTRGKPFDFIIEEIPVLKSPQDMVSIRLIAWVYVTLSLLIFSFIEGGKRCLSTWVAAHLSLDIPHLHIGILKVVSCCFYTEPPGVYLYHMRPRSTHAVIF